VINDGKAFTDEEDRAFVVETVDEFRAAGATGSMDY